MSTSQRKSGAILSYVSLVINALVSFIYVPLLLGFLTTSEYGVYELIGSIIAYLSVMDMGLSTTLNRFYVKEKTIGSRGGVENLLAISAIIYAILTVLAVVAAALFDAALDPMFGNTFTTDEIKLAHQMMILVMINCVVVLPGNWFLALINANERFVFARSLAIVKYVLQTVVILIVLFWRSSALLVLVVQVLFNTAVIIFYIIYVKSKLNIKVKYHKWDSELFRSLFTFSMFILLNMIFDQVFWKTGQVVLGAVSGAAAVAVYGIATKVITVFMQFSTAISSVFLPKLTSIAAETKDMAQINEIFNRIGHIQAILVWGICGAFVVLGQDFIFLWAGLDFSEAYFAIVALMLCQSVSLIQNLGISILQAKNQLAFRSVVYIVIAILDVVISIPISQEYGVIGCSLVAAILLFLGTGPIMNYYYKYSIGIDIRQFFKEVFPVLIPASITSFIVYALHLYFSIPVSWGSFAIGCILYIGLYFVLLWLFGFNEYEKGLLRSFLKNELCEGKLKDVYR